MKTLSLMLDDVVYEETEQLLKKIYKPRNRFINEALQYYNRLQKKSMMAQMLVAESKLVSEESMNILREFHQLDAYDA